MTKNITFCIILFVGYIIHYSQKTNLMNEISIIKSENKMLLKQAIRAKEILKGDSLHTILYY
jgi:hypothetical protein